MAVQDRYQRYLRDQAHFFDELITEDWDTYRSEPWDESRRYEVAALFRIVQPRLVLDIGCGCGFHDREMAGYPFVERVDAIDPSPASIAKADEHYPHPNVKRWTSGFAELPAERAYDLAVSFQVFEHLDEPDAYLARMHDVVRPGGHVALVMPNRNRLRNRLRRLKGLAPELLDVMHYREYTAKETFALGQRHGMHPAGAFGYGIDGPLVARLSSTTKLRLGERLPFLAQGIGVVMRVEGA